VRGDSKELRGNRKLTKNIGGMNEGNRAQLNLLETKMPSGTTKGKDTKKRNTCGGASETMHKGKKGMMGRGDTEKRKV